MKKTFSILEAYRWAWQRFKEHFQFLAVTVIALGLIFVLLDQLSEGPYRKNIFVILTQIIFAVVLAVGVITVSLNIHNNVKPQISDFFITVGVFWRYLVVQISVNLLILLGFIPIIIIGLLVFFSVLISSLNPYIFTLAIISAIPGLYVICRLQFPLFVLVDEKPDRPLEAVKKSWNITRGLELKIFGLILSIGIINFIGAIPMGLGLIITAPVSVLALVFVYKSLEGISAQSPTISGEAESLSSTITSA